MKILFVENFASQDVACSARSPLLRSLNDAHSLDGGRVQPQLGRLVGERGI